MKKCVILLGAGATSLWDAPTSDNIRCNLIKDSDNKTINGVNAGKFIYELLKENSNEDVGFEEIINTVETLHNYYAPANKLLSSELFVPTSEIKSLLNETILPPVYWNFDEGDKKLLILQEIYNRFLQIVRSNILKYETTFEKYNNQNGLLKNFLIDINRKYSLRIYSLNYDTIIPNKLFINDNELNFFDGYETDADIEDNVEYYKPNIKRILEEDSNVYYNLHGSIYYTLRDKDIIKSDYEYYKADSAIKFEKGITFIESGNPEEHILLAPIITGFNKLQKITTDPFRAFNNSFYNDTLNTDLYIIIGYSFSDPYINKILRNGIKENKNSTFICITKDGQFPDKIKLNDCNSIYKNISLGIIKKNNEPKDLKNIEGCGYCTFNDSTNGLLNFNLFYNGFENFLQNYRQLKYLIH